MKVENERIKKSQEEQPTKDESTKIRTANILVSEREFVGQLGYVMYNMAPNRSPRFADTIIQSAKEKFREHPMCYNDNEYRTIRIFAQEGDTVSIKDVESFCKDILMKIPEFEQLNLSQIEFENGVQVNDPNRPKFKFTALYDVETEDSWKHDFVDLDAFIGNFASQLIPGIRIDEDCFGCIRQPKNSQSSLAHGDSELCKNCLCRQGLRNNYESCRNPRGKYTFACKFDCYKSKYICCEECDFRDTCSHRCLGNSSTCGNAINHVENQKEELS